MAVQNIACSIGFGCGTQIGQVVTALWFGISKGYRRFAADDARDDCIGLCTANSFQSTTANNDSLKVRLNRHNLAHFFHNQRVFKVTATKAAMFLRKRRAQHAEFGRKGGPDTGVAACFAVDHFLARIKAVAIGKKARQRVADHVLRFGVGEIHYFCPSLVVPV